MQKGSVLFSVSFFLFLQILRKWSILFCIFISNYCGYKNHWDALTLHSECNPIKFNIMHLFVAHHTGRPRSFNSVSKAQINCASLSEHYHKIPSRQTYKLVSSDNCMPAMIRRLNFFELRSKFNEIEASI